MEELSAIRALGTGAMIQAKRKKQHNLLKAILTIEWLQKTTRILCQTSKSRRCLVVTRPRAATAAATAVIATMEIRWAMQKNLVPHYLGPPQVSTAHRIKWLTRRRRHRRHLRLRRPLLTIHRPPLPTTPPQPPKALLPRLRFLRLASRPCLCESRLVGHSRASSLLQCPARLTPRD